MKRGTEPRRRRITVNLRDDEYETLQRLSAANGESMSLIVSGLVEAVTPALGRVVEIVEAAATAQADVLDGLRAATAKGEALMSPLLAAAVEGWDQTTSRQLDALRPPPSNNGGQIS